MTQADAQYAYRHIVADLRERLRPSGSNRNTLMEISPFEACHIDSDSNTFTLNIYNLDFIPLGLPNTGLGYQVLLSDSIYHAAPTSRGRDGLIGAPRLIDAVLTVSYRFSFLRWIWAKFFWVLVTFTRIAIVCIVVAIVAIAIRYIPWRWIAGWLVQIPALLKSMRAAMPMPTPTPTPTVFGAPPKVGQ